MIVARRYVISGRVQGVGFRFFAETAARREGLHGWVKNLPDGRVEISAEGDAEAVERFEHHIRRGPRGACVDDVTWDATEPRGWGYGFTIR